MKPELATKLYNSGIKKILERIKEQGIQKAIESGEVSLYIDESGTPYLNIGPFDLVRTSGTTIESRFDTFLGKTAHGSNIIRATFENKINSEFKEISEFIDWSISAYEEYAISRMSFLESRFLKEPEEEKVEKIEEIVEKPVQPVEKLEDPTSWPKTEDSAKTEVLNVQEDRKEQKVQKTSQKFKK